MRNKKLIIVLIACITVLLTVGIYRILNKETSNPGDQLITTGQAARAVALLESSVAECEAAENQFEKKEEWYVPYMNRLYEVGYFQTEETKPTGKTAVSAFTYGDLGKLYENMKITDKELLADVNNNKSSRGITNAEWAVILEKIADYKQITDMAEEKTIVVATVSNVASLDSWKVVTTTGDYTFTGLAMDYYIDRQISVLVRGDQILCVKELTSSHVLYPNTLATSIENGNIHAFINGVVRTFEIAEDVANTNVIVDIEVKNGEVVAYKVKEGYISGKLLKYTDTTVEIEGMGSFPISSGFRVYKTYGNLETKTLYDMIVGYDVQKFLIQDGEVCAVLIDRDFVAKDIRVVIKNNGFQSIYHDSVTISSEQEFEFTYNGQLKKFRAGEEFTIAMDSPYLESGSLTVQAAGTDGKIMLTSLERGYGTPAYRGTLEIVKTADGLVVINELPLEEYLYGVVPSEMPYTYHAEALKAQAICARSYAYKHMQSNTYAYLGAHVDDSTDFQVYNNSQERETAIAAVDATYGQVMLYDNQPISAFFYSTSCGSGADARIWGGDGYAYIQGKLLSGNTSNIDLTDEAQFKMFITNKYDTYDKDYAWYRWNVTMSLEKLEDSVNSQLAALYQSNPKKVLTLSGGEYVSRDIDSVGKIKSIEVGSRGTGGVLESVIIRGEDATVMIKTESLIRQIFNPSGCEIHKQDGSVTDTFTKLPSAFFAITEVRDGDSLTGYLFEGGGYGHGAGMSQNAANTMGSLGIGYADILKFFYTGVELVQIY